MLGLVSDLHGNSVALRAVLDDGHRHGVDEWWVLGDLVAIGVEPIETLELLTGLRRVSVLRGNTDRYVLTGARPPAPESLREEVEASFSWTADVVEAAGWTGWLRQLPTRLARTLPDGTELVAVHASPAADDDGGITASTPASSLASMFDAAGADLLVAGHTHLPTSRRVGRRQAVNLGSVSNPVTADRRASYVVLDPANDGYRLSHRYVEYDHDAVVARVRASDHPAAAYICSFQQKARG